jgi:hypothetical protein
MCEAVAMKKDARSELERLIAEVARRATAAGAPEAQVAPLVAALRAAQQAPDPQRAARELERAMAATLGTTPKRVEQDAMSREIERRVAEQVAQSLRDRGLTPAADMKVEPDED